jgi:hypothetical protein
MPTFSTSRGFPRLAHGLKHAFAASLANARAVSETYVRIAYERPWDPPASNRSAAGCRG